MMAMLWTDISERSSVVLLHKCLGRQMVSIREWRQFATIRSFYRHHCADYRILEGRLRDRRTPLSPLRVIAWINTTAKRKAKETLRTPCPWAVTFD
jgi:hypothetical protein